MVELFTKNVVLYKKHKNKEGKIMITEKSPIAVFDSGMGGVSVLRQLYKLMPCENYLYFGDSKNAPYGTKTTEEIKALTIKNVSALIDKGAKAVVIACNTATAAAARELREMYKDIPIIGLEPALKPAALSKKHPTVVVLATPLTLREEKFQILHQRFKDEADVIKLPAPDLVRFVEEDRVDSEEMTEYLEKLFEGIDKSKIDCLVLGCTHFPFAKKRLCEFLGNKVEIFNGAEGAARQTKRLLQEKNLLNSLDEKGNIIFENSDESHIEFSKRLFYRK